MVEQKRRSDSGASFLFYGLAASTIVFATAVVTAVIAEVVSATAATEEDDDEDNNPRTVVTTKVTHNENLLNVFITYYADFKRCVTGKFLKNEKNV